jgi:hypothetical protein
MEPWALFGAKKSAPGCGDVEQGKNQHHQIQRSLGQRGPAKLEKRNIRQTKDKKHNL